VNIQVLWALAVADIRARYGRGPLRVVKWLLDPFALVGVYLVFVALLLVRPGNAPGLSLACAVVPFQLVMSTTINALRVVEVRSPLLVNLAFPRVLLPAASLITESLAFAASGLLLVGMMVAYGIAPTVAVLWLVPLVCVTLLLALGFSYAAALCGLWYPDVRPLVVSVVRTLLFVAPGLVALDTIHGSARDLLKINPFTGLFEGYRAILIGGHAPEAWHLLFPLGIAALILAVTIPVFRAEAPHLAKVAT
jgi:ABC-type polysaccharide/polyol phosphate export permease